MKKLIGYFFKGLLVILPVGITALILFKTVQFADSFINFGFPGLGLLAVVAGITLLGFLFSNILGETLFHLLDELMSRTPLVKIIYSSVKDLIEAFVGEKKKFNEPVLVQLHGAADTHIVGFVTRKDLTHIGLPGKVAVYFPFSYSLTGQLLIVPSERITPLNASATELMKFAVSGGVAGFQEE